MRISGAITGLLMLILYVFIFIPFILQELNSMFIDWINSSNQSMFQQQWCETHYVINQSTGEIDNYTDCKTIDFRPMLIFLWEFAVYFGVPLTLIIYSVKHR